MQILSEGKHQQAIVIFDKLNEQHPNDCNILNGLAYAYFGVEKYEESIKTFKNITILQPLSASAWINLAGIYFENDQQVLAEINFKKALEIDETLSHVWHLLCLTLFNQKKYTELLACQHKVSEYDPFVTPIEQAHNAIASGQTNIAIELCNQVLEKNKRHPQALFILAMLAAQKGELEAALTHIETGLIYSPYHDHLRSFQSQLYVQIRLYSKALTASKMLVQQKPSEVGYWLLHADNLVNTGQFEFALDAYHQAQRLVPEDGFIKLQQAHIYKALGANELCIKAYTECLKDEKTSGSAYWALSNLSAVQFSKHDLTELKSMQLDPDLPAEQACQATFALAKYYEDNKEYKLAFSTYRSANLNRPGVNFNPSKYQKKCEAIIKTFSTECLQVRAPIKPAEATPIFIVGLPRSGSTLVEQILASHSLVEGTMELKIIPAIARQVFLQSIEKNKNTSGSLDEFTPTELTYFGENYLKESQIYRTNKPFFIDKLPPNFQHIGLIKKILPTAIIIDVRRQPMACGFGMYKQYFGSGHDFSYDLQHIAFYYQQYLLLMQHWQQVLPNEVYWCQYEALVSNTEQQLKDILAFCNLPFEAECLTFYKNSRAVRTASSDQVRKPINSLGLSMWKNYQEQLEPLKASLGANIIESYSHFIDE